MTSQPGVAAPAPMVRTGQAARTGDAFVILTGGGTPLSNEYSHYLQARAMSQYFRDRYPAEAVWTFFGIGNREGAPGILADVHREVKDGQGRLIDTWFPGTLPDNRPATKAAFLQALRDEILPRVAGGGTLYLFVGDHGELTEGKKGESAVTMWQLKRGRRNRGWEEDNREILTVTDLRTALAAGLGKGQVVFCMTQCHAGGFHFLGVPRDITQPGAALPRIAGFTATDEENVASGCVADPDPELWQGYERFIPQALLGTDLLSGARRGEPLTSFAAAHEAATLVDRTIDKPYGSSDQLLERWATHLETTLSRSLRATDAERAALVAYAGLVDGRPVKLVGDPALLQRAERFRKFTDMLAAKNPATAKLLNGGTRAELQAALAEPETREARGTRRRGGPSARRVWSDTLRPAWAAAVRSGHAAVLPAAAVAFEKRLLELEDGGRDYFSAGSRREGLLNEVYWESGLSKPVVTDRAKADAVPRWAVERRERILDWAKTSGDEKVRAAGASIAQAPRRGAGARVEPEPVIDPTAAERVLFYRRVLAAWNFLLLTNNRAALAQLATLIEVENTPLPGSLKG
ncbi:MAG: hypothetical protein NTV51_07350 [Verrucomicrobia bacterium]|nr:hypothetical protein [Verrucomicrobiota bacterium]